MLCKICQFCRLCVDLSVCLHRQGCTCSVKHASFANPVSICVHLCVCVCVLMHVCVCANARAGCKRGQLGEHGELLFTSGAGHHWQGGV